MRKRRRTSSLSSAGEGILFPTLQLWILRILVPLGGSRKFVSAMGWDSDNLAEALGLNAYCPLNDEEPFHTADALRLLRDKLLHLESESDCLSVVDGLPAELLKNAEMLCSRLGLTTVERDILVFTVMLQSETALQFASDYLGNLTNAKVVAALAVLVGHPEADISRAMSGNSKLVSSGLVFFSDRYADEMHSRLQVLSEQFAGRMMSCVSDPLLLIRDTVAPGQPSTLSVADYPHVAKDVNLLLAYLENALKEGRQGVNIFIYGPPGTGKTELARLLGGELSCELLEIAAEDEDGDPIKGEQRLRAYRAAQSFFAQHRAVLVFDEAEDIFNDGSPFGGRSTAQLRKAWFNRLLETSQVPTIWLSNSRHGLDGAFIRRFDLSFRLDVPPESQRKVILERIAGDYLSASDLALLSSADCLAPAVMTRAVSVLEAIRDKVPDDSLSDHLKHLINNTLETQGHGRLEPQSCLALPAYYDPDLINTEADLASIGKELAETTSARICLYGPPGTGKTAFGHWLASQLDKRLLVKRGSDLLGKFIGETEARIASAFRAAREDDAILLIDEVDSFLRDRRGSVHSWEQSMVNEMLTQMESFNGLFIASTNLMDGLDQAALRRFDIKLKFDYLKSEQAWTLLCRQCEAFGLPQPPLALQADLTRLSGVTPGDFAVVAKQNRFRKFASAGDILAFLLGEQALKEGGQFTRRGIGFVH